MRRAADARARTRGSFGGFVLSQLQWWSERHYRCAMRRVVRPYITAPSMSHDRTARSLHADVATLSEILSTHGSEFQKKLSVKEKPERFGSRMSRCKDPRAQKSNTGRAASCRTNVFPILWRYVCRCRKVVSRSTYCVSSAVT
jgi:hypothetical protein